MNKNVVTYRAGLNFTHDCWSMLLYRIGKDAVHHIRYYEEWGYTTLDVCGGEWLKKGLLAKLDSWFGESTLFNHSELVVYCCLPPQRVRLILRSIINDMMNIILFILLVLSPATSFHYPLSSKRSLRRRHFGYPTSQSQSSLLSSLDDGDPPSNQSSDNRPTIIFPGGGLFFYWQAGVVVRIEWRHGYVLQWMTSNF